MWDKTVEEFWSYGFPLLTLGLILSIITTFLVRRNKPVS